MKRIKIRGKVQQHWGQVWCNDFDGREYTHHHVFPNVFLAQKFADKVKAKGTIDEAHWSMRVPYGCMAWLYDGHEEEAKRYD